MLPKKIRVYQSSDGRLPYVEWLRGLRDQRARQKIQARIDRVSLGNLGDSGSLGEGVQELKINCGPGYRVYFAQEGDEVVILLIGGEKHSQDEDIKKAKSFWKKYKTEKAYADR